MEQEREGKSAGEGRPLFFTSPLVRLSAAYSFERYFRDKLLVFKRFIDILKLINQDSFCGSRRYVLYSRTVFNKEKIKRNLISVYLDFMYLFLAFLFRLF